MQDGRLATAGVEVVSTAAVLVVDSTEEAPAVAVSVGDISPVAVFTALAFVVGGTGVETGTITDSLTMSSSAATVIRGGGTGAIRTDITVTTITRTVTMDTGRTHTATMDTADTATMIAVMDTAMGADQVTDTAMAVDQGIPGVRGVGDKAGYASVRSPAC